MDAYSLVVLGIASEAVDLGTDQEFRGLGFRGLGFRV